MQLVDDSIGDHEVGMAFQVMENLGHLLLV
jgi:hypothetical protein